MKKILFLIGSLDMGGAEKVLVDTANMLVDNGYDITVQTIVDQGPLKSKLDSRVHYRTIIKSKNRYIKSIKLKLWSKIIPPKYVYNLYVKQDYDYEVAFLEGMPTKIISASNNKKYAWVHTDFKNNFSSLVNYKSFDECKDVYSNFDKIICVSNDVQDGFNERFGTIFQTEVKYNFINSTSIIEQSKQSIEEIDSWNKEIPSFISVGKLVEYKRFDRLVRIAKMLKDDGYKFAIRIIGDGPNYSMLMNLIDALDVADCVTLLGMKQNPLPYVANSNLFICSSIVEGYSTVVTEALILGTPVITTNCSGMKEQFAGYDCGKIVKNDENDLYLAIKEYLDNPQLNQHYIEATNERSKEIIASNNNSIYSLF